MTYELKCAGFYLKSKERPPTWFIILFFVAGFAIYYFIFALVLYAVSQLFGVLTFSWLNAVWLAVVLVAIRWVLSAVSPEEGP